MSKQYFQLLREFVVTDFKLRYKHSVLGLVWVVLKPLAFFFILYLVWSAFANNQHDYRIYLLSGVIIMSFVDDATLFGMQSLLVKAHILLKVNFPREILLFSAITVAVANFLINVVVFLIIVFVTGSYHNIHFSWLSAPLLLLTFGTLLLILIAAGLFDSILYVKFRDLDHLLTLVLRLLFWGTPVVYQIEMLASRPTVQKIIELSPVTIILQTARASILEGPSLRWSSFGPIVFILLGALIAVALGYWYFAKNIHKIAEQF